MMFTGGGGVDSQYKVLSELLSDQAVFITSPKTSLANYWGGIAPPAPQCLLEKITFPYLKLDYYFQWYVYSKFSPRTLSFARIMQTAARDFDLHDFSAIPSLMLFHGAAKLRGV